jgi:hypothetical protein
LGEAEMAGIGLRDCRHTFASLMIDAGCNAKALSEVAGDGPPPRGKQDGARRLLAPYKR